MTPTSATGASAEQGFTLVELMVALFIMGLAGGAVLLSVPNGRSQLAAEAEALGARLKRAQEEAILTNHPIDLSLTEDGYRFRTFARGRWSPLSDEPFAAHSWEAGVRGTLSAQDGRASLRFDPTGSADPGVVILTRETRRVRIRVQETGQVSIDAPAG